MTDQVRAAVASVVAVGAVLLAAGCGSSQPSPARGAAGGLQTLAAGYLAIAQPANHQLDHEFDSLMDHESDNLAAAQADLRAAAATERRFDRQLIAITFPPQTEPFVHLLVDVNQARATLTVTVAAATVTVSCGDSSRGWTRPTSRWNRRSGSSAASSGCHRPIQAELDGRSVRDL